MITVFAVALDIAVKAWASGYLASNGPLTVIRGVFRLTYVENRGAAFSILQGKRWFFIILTFIVLAFMVWIFIKKKVKGKWGNIALVFIFSGAVGNLIDRISKGYVVDMFDFCLIDFPVFNVADIFLNVGAIMAVIYVLFIDKDLLGGKKNGK
ncbi:MAG: signal peptidase II [Clostridia bacterium]|nr:signal peptidase II [Clostridia bacterium]